MPEWRLLSFYPISGWPRVRIVWQCLRDNLRHESLWAALRHAIRLQIWVRVNRPSCTMDNFGIHQTIKED